jgi:anti-sigma regulatory factor (Ser/Thr protein kinase)
MEVTNISDKVTHAVIGRGQVESFGMSEDAELYHILSSALYSRKKEAAVREILCNAWDSHVENEITDIPVEVTLTDDKLTVRDFGAGIPPEKIKPVYGTYGRSTKQHDGRQTGGFGLGSKAPFAYTDHFEVVSLHNEQRTIYKMSQSNAEVGGKPSITTIVSVPTDESGLQVSFNLKNREDRHEFETLIRRIVEMGDMNVTLNNSPLPTIPFCESPLGFMLVRKERFFRSNSALSTEAVYVRYGHVVYPLKEDDRIAHLYDEVLIFLATLNAPGEQHYGRRGGDWVLVLEAEPHSISVVPSREDLSMTDKTVGTLSEMLRKFMGYARGRLEDTMTEMFTDAVDKLGIAGTPADVFRTKKVVPLIDRVQLKQQNYIYNFDDLSRHYLKLSYPKFENFRTKDLRIKVDALITSGFGNRGLLQSFKSELLSGKTAESVTQWFHRRFIGLALRKADPKKNIDPDRLYVYATLSKGKYGTVREPGHVLAKDWVAPRIEDCFPFLRGLVILTHVRHGPAMDRAHKFPICQNWVGKPLNSLCYVVQKKPEKVEQARKHFEKLGFHVLDLTIKHPWEANDVVLVAPKRVVKPRVKGLPRLDAGLTASRKNLSTDRLFVEDAVRVIKPTVVIKISKKKEAEGHFERLTRDASAAIARLYGKDIGVVQNSVQMHKFIEEGAVRVTPWVYKKILEEYKNNPKLKEYYSFSIAHRDKDPLPWETGKFFKLVHKDKELRQHFGFPDPIGEDEVDIIKIFEGPSDWEYRNDPVLKEIKTLVDSWPLDPLAEKLVKKLKDNKIVSMLDPADIESALVNTNGYYTPKHQKTARQILLIALEG